MSKPRIYQPQHLQAGQLLLLDSAASHHVAKVLRLRAKDQLEVFNGTQAFIGSLIASQPSSSKLASHKLVEVLLEDEIVSLKLAEKLSVHLAPALIKPAPFDVLLQKTTELGVAQITPLVTEFTQLRISAKEMARPYPHWSKVIISACEQSGRYTIPQLNPGLSLHAFLQAYQPQPIRNQPRQRLKLICHPYPAKERSLDIFPVIRTSVQDAPQLPLEVVVLLGPEGGFSDREVVMALDAGFQAIQLSSHILRADTAAIAIMSLLGYAGFELG